VGDVTIPSEWLIQIVGFAASGGLLYGFIRSEIKGLREAIGGTRADVDKLIEAGLNQRVGELERHAPKVEQIAPLIERMGNFERRFEHEFERVRSDIKDVSQAVRDLAAAIVKRTAA
jgi:hypothetical protein